MAQYDEFTIPNPASDLDNVVLGFNLADNMSADWWTAVDTDDGTKLRVHKEDGTELPFDIIGFDDVAETGVLWVRWDGTITSAGTQKIRIAPPNDLNLPYGADDTYGRLAAWSDYEHVWTLNEDPSGTAPQFLDRAGTDDMETFGTPSSVAGLLGNAVEFAFSSGEYLQTENLTGPTATDSLTFSIWTNIATKEAFMMAFGESGGNMGMTYRADQDKFYAWIDASNYTGLVTHQTTPQIGEWNKITFKLTPTEFNILMNGVAGNAPESNVGTLNSNAKDEWVISRRSSTTDRNWDGQLQYATVRNLAISDDQDAYEHDNQVDMATFWGVGTWVGGGTTYNESFTIGQSNELSPLGNIIVDDSIEIGQQSGILEESTLEGIASFVLSNQSIISLASQLLVEDAVQINQVSSVTVNGGLTVEDSFTLALQNAMSFEATEAVVVSFSLGSQSSVTPDSQLDAQDSIDLAQTSGLTLLDQLDASGTFVLNMQVAIGLLANAIVEAGLSISSLSEITVTGQSITSNVTLPDGRTLKIKLENRTLTIEKDNRTLNIS